MSLYSSAACEDNSITMRFSRVANRMLTLTVLLLVAMPAWAATGTVAPQLPDPGSVAGVNRQDQQQLGLKAAGEVYKQMPVLPDASPVTQYVQQLGRKLQTVIPASNSWPYQFHVVQQSEINAFALPGGPIFVNIGTIKAADNEAELAGVMAHEMSHVYMQHSVKQASKESLAEGILGVIGGMLGDSTAADIARIGIQVGAGTVFLKYSRSDEAQADAVGAVIMYKAGYDPHALAQFFQKLETQPGSNGPQFLSDHPNPGNRLAAIDEEVRNWPPKNYLSPTTAFTRARQDATSVKAYTGQEIADGAKQGLWAQQNQKTGAAPSPIAAASSTDTSPAKPSLADVTYAQVKPSDSFSEFEGGAFVIGYPANWKTEDEGGTSFRIAPEAGASQEMITYGVVISTAPVSGSLAEATHALVETLQKSNPGMRAVDAPRKIKVGALHGRAVNLTANSPVQSNGQPLPEHDWLVTLPRADGDMLYLVFIAPERDFAQLRATYEKMLSTVQVK